MTLLVIVKVLLLGIEKGGQIVMNRKNGEEKVKLSRIARIDEELRSGKYPNSEELAAKMEVSPRTILRDIEYLRDSYGAPIEYDYVKRGFYYTEPNFFIKSVVLTEDEVKTITIHDTFLGMANSNEFNTSFRKAIGKILAVVPENQTKDLPFAPSEENKNDFLFAPTIVVEGNIVSALNSAVKNKEVIEVEYWISDNRKYTVHTLKPVNIFFQRHHYYLLAWKDNNQKKPGVYSINRMRNIHNTGKHFMIPAGFKISDYLKKDADVCPKDNKLYLFELSFPKEVASEAIEKTYYHNQIIELCKDGTVLVTFRSTQLYEVFNWVLEQGSKVKVLNPPELVAMVKREVQKVGQYYL